MADNLIRQRTEQLYAAVNAATLAYQAELERSILKLGADLERAHLEFARSLVADTMGVSDGATDAKA
jgi:hypothetical protein